MGRALLSGHQDFQELEAVESCTSLHVPAVVGRVGGEGGGDGGDGEDGEGGGASGGDGADGGNGGDDGGPGMFMNGMIPAPPMRKRLGVFAASAFAVRSMESTSAAARIISLTRATERVESPASSWAATPETCGAAMLVPLMVLVAALLEPTHAARISEPGACAHARRGLRTAAGEAGAGEGQVCWRAGGWTCTGGCDDGIRGLRVLRDGGDLHVDASAVVGER